jgi:5'-nucleotidase
MRFSRCLSPRPTRPLRPALHWAGLALSAALLAGCASAPAPASGPVTLRLIAFNDFHGNLESANLSLPWPDPADKTKTVRLAAGGAAPLASLVHALRAGSTQSIVISSGDLIGATPLVSALFRHESTVEAMNLLGLDIAIPGNHEFDAGRTEYLRILNGGCAPNAADDPVVSCALGPYRGARFASFVANVESADGKTLLPASIVREVGGVKVGFIGAVTKTTPSIVVPSGVAGLNFTDEAQAINREAARLKAQGVQALVAVIHEGGDTGMPGEPEEWNDAACPSPRGPIFEISQRLSQDVDVIFSAHTHQGYRCVGADLRPIMQATALGRGVSVVDLVINRQTGEIDRQATRHRNLPVMNERTDAALRAHVLATEPAPWAEVLKAVALGPNPAAPANAQAVAQRVAEYAAAAAPRAQRPVGQIQAAFTRAGRTDSSAGRLIADAQFEATRMPERGGAQFSLMNPGGVRADLPCRGTPPCTVTYGDVFTMQPFGNSLVVMTLTGAQLRQMLEDQQRPGRSSPTLLIPSAGLSYRWLAANAHGQRVQDLQLNGQPISPTQELRFTVNSFLADGGDGFTMLVQGRNRLGGAQDLDALMSYLQTPRTPAAHARIGLVE